MNKQQLDQHVAALKHERDYVKGHSPEDKDRLAAIDSDLKHYTGVTPAPDEEDDDEPQTPATDPSATPGDTPTPPAARGRGKHGKGKAKTPPAAS